ncbi:MAG: hypothetical protein IH935_08340, partial [Acidobacteria bacterium]|nr:hypothetical protein [Acidobacteriota bacterium]
ETIELSPSSPAIFSTDSSGSGQGAILIANTASIAAPVGTFSGSRPVERGGFLSIFCAGLGDVTNPPGIGEAASGNPLSTTMIDPTVTIGDAPAPVSFSGLAPGFVGLYQVNVQIPAGVAPGPEVPLVLFQNGVPSNPVTIAVQ